MKERRDGVVESCLYVSLVSADSFRRYTIIAENAIGIGRQRTVLTQRTCSVSFTEQYYFLILFCSLAVLDPRVTIRYDTRCYFNVRSKADISKYGLATPWTYFLHLSLSSVILIHGESCPRLDVVHSGRAWSSSPVCTWHCSLHYLFLQTTPLFSHGVIIMIMNVNLYSA